jgi:hypothetical protein
MHRTRLAVGLWVILGIVHIASSNGTIASDDALQPLITTSELVVGQNRFAFGLARRGRLIERAEVFVRLYSLEATGASLLAETNAPFRPIARLVSGKKVHKHADGTRHLHDSGTAVRGIYVAQLAFPHPGDWGIEIIMRQPDASSETARLTVIVREESTVLAVGSPAPRSRNLIASDVKDLRQIDTSELPDSRLHQIRIADAIAMRKPQLVVFATPQFCTSRMCGPVVDIVRALLPTYGKRVIFTHQEIWEDFASKKVFTTVEEWRLQSEPWIFVVDGGGIIRAKFEGLVTERELGTALEVVLRPTTARR